MGVVHEPVEDAIGQRGISYLFVPPRGRYAQIRLTRFPMMDTDLMAVSDVQVVCIQKQAAAAVKK